MQTFKNRRNRVESDKNGKSDSKHEWQRFWDFCNRYALSSWWFRGVSDGENHKLLPKVGRGFEDKNWTGRIEEGRSASLAKYELNIFNSFKRRARLQLQPIPETPLEWLAVAQHHGVPTRLLDWTPNPLMAAWFAMNDDRAQDDQVARIYAVRVKAKVKTDEGVDPFKLKDKSPVFVIAPHWHPRVRAQRGCFSIHPVPNTPWTLEGLKTDHFDIQYQHWRGFRRRLFYFGFDAATAFPDLSGLGAALAWQFQNRIGIGDVGY